MKTILVSTYAVNPLKGSEDGMGWNYIMQVARFNKVIAVTRENNRQAIEKYMKENPCSHYDNITFLYFDLPYWMRFWKRKSRGAMLYYLMWQRALPGFVKREGIDFDIVHNLNFHNDWSPSYLWKLKKPFVWGPVGHHPLIPKQYLKDYSKKYILKDRLTWGVKQYFWKISPSLRKTVKKSQLIWGMNSSVEKCLDVSNKNLTVSASVATQNNGWDTGKNNDTFSVISAGRLVPLKGFDLTIRAFAKFVENISEKERDNVSLTIVGSGPEEALLKQIARDLGLQDVVKFIDWIERKDLMQMMNNASCFLFPSHEGAGMVVPEALSFGLPVICLDNEGPGEFVDSGCGYKISVQPYDQTVLGLSSALNELYSDKEKLKLMQKNAREHFVKYFHWDRRGEKLLDIYKTVGV